MVLTDARCDDNRVNDEEYRHGRNQARFGLMDVGVHCGGVGEYSTENLRGVVDAWCAFSSLWGGSEEMEGVDDFASDLGLNDWMGADEARKKIRQGGGTEEVEGGMLGINCTDSLVQA